MAQFVTIEPKSGKGSGGISVSVPEYFGRVSRQNTIRVKSDSDPSNYDECVVTQEGRGTYVSGDIKFSESSTGSAISNNYTIAKGGKVLYLIIPVTNGKYTRIDIQRYKKSDNSAVSFNSSVYGYCKYKISNSLSYSTLNINSVSNLSAGLLVYSLTTNEGDNNTYKVIFEIELPKNNNDFDIYYSISVSIDGIQQYINSPNDLSNISVFNISQLSTSLTISPTQSKIITTGSGTSNNTTEYVSFNGTTYADVQISNVLDRVNLTDVNKIGLQFSPSYLSKDGVVRITIPAIKDVTGDSISTSKVTISEGNDNKTFTIKRQNRGSYYLSTVYNVYGNVGQNCKIEFTTNCKVLYLSQGSTATIVHITTFLNSITGCKIGGKNVSYETVQMSDGSFALCISRDEGTYGNGEIHFNYTNGLLDMYLQLRGVGITYAPKEFEIHLT